MRAPLAAFLMLGLAACASAPKKPPAVAVAPPGTGHVQGAPPAGGRKVSPYAPAQEDPGTRGDYTAGGLYKPGVADSTPDYLPDVDAIPEPEVVAAPRSRVGNRSSYTVLGQQYHVLASAQGYVEQGNASYYGNKFHGRRTSNLEVYDMYAFTAAHKTLPLPSFARVTNRDNGKSVVVRVNDRGPFHAGRVIDLSYAAAVKLGITQRGTGRVEVRALTPGAAASPTVALAATMKPAGSEPAGSGQPMPASTLDRLVAAMPTASAAAGELPPGVRIATGKPTVLSNAARPPVPGAVASTALPVTLPASATTTAGTTTAANAGNDYRFDMRQDGKAMSADEFEAWMTSRQVRVATGKPVPSVAKAAAERPGKHAAPASPQAAAPPAPRQAAAVAALRASAPPAAVTLQVASFAARGNADRALAMLLGAGIDGARLNDANANGQRLWRLRVGPLDAAHAPELAARIAGLGFGPPQRVRD